ncbi:hypothetical protein [Sphingobium aromaticiconvertens]|uniref:hypothetical protein n=1 Tax=Sphingobium aromaticiconvertens TaxID=365341 RepID=UPI00301B3D74
MATVREPATGEEQSSLSAAIWDDARMENRVGMVLCLIPALYLAGVMVFAVANARAFMTDLPQCLRYVVVPGLLLSALLWAAFRARAAWRLQIGGVACGILFALFLFEAVLEFRYLQIIRSMVGTEIRQVTNADPFALPPGRTLRQLNTGIGTTQLSEAVLGGVPGSKVDLCKAGNVPVKYHADQFGFRNPPEAAAQPSPRILMIGDSFVEGICLPDGQDIASRVRAREGSVLSLGSRGAGPLLELAMLGRFGPVRRPDWTVIIFYEGNDWQNLANELRTPWLVEALGPAPNFGSSTIRPKAIQAARAQIARWDNEGPVDTIDLIKQGNVARNFLGLHQSWVRLGLGYPKSAPEIPQFALVLQRARTVASGWGGRTAIVYLPQSTRFMGLLPNGFAYDSMRRKVLKAAQHAGVPVIDMTPHFKATPDPIALYGENHLSPAGADMVANVLSVDLRTIEQGKAE